jgi:hypothetical protein
VTCENRFSAAEFLPTFPGHSRHLLGQKEKEPGSAFLFGLFFDQNRRRLAYFDTTALCPMFYNSRSELMKGIPRHKRSSSPPSIFFTKSPPSALAVIIVLTRPRASATVPSFSAALIVASNAIHTSSLVIS